MVQRRNYEKAVVFLCETIEDMHEQTDFKDNRLRFYVDKTRTPIEHIMKEPKKMNPSEKKVEN